MRTSFCFIFVFISCLALHGLETEQRTWTSNVGSQLEAKLIAEENGSVVLERPDQSRLNVRLDQLSAEDQAYVERVTQIRGNIEIEGLPAQPGQISEQITCRSDSKWHYYLYLPEDFHDAREWPVWYIMSPNGGTNSGSLKRYIEGAEKFGCILALSVESKNDFADSDLAIEAMAADVYARLPVADNLAFSSGMSGGSRMAYLLAERDKNIAGVLACGSGSGVYLKEKDFRQAELRSSVYIYSLIGTNCFNRTEAFKSHEAFPDDYRLRFFAGKHVWAPADLVTEGMARVLGAGLERYSGAGAEKLRGDYAKIIQSMAAAKVEDEPWEAYYWAMYLSDFPGPRVIQGDAAKLARELETNSKVERARAAERDMLRLADEHFRVNYKQDQIPNDSRKKDANRMADKYIGVPHSDLLRSLGDPS